MSDYSGLGDLVDQIKDASASIAQSDTAFNTRLNGFEKSLNELYLKTCRPGFDGGHDNASFERKEAIDFLQIAPRYHGQQGRGGRIRSDNWRRIAAVEKPTPSCARKPRAEMKIITLVFAIALMSSVAWANTALATSTTTTFHNQSGFVTGKARSEGGITTFYDPAGRVTGKATQRGRHNVL